MRRDGFTNGATYEEIIEMSVKSKNVQYDILVSDEKYDADEISLLRAFYSEHNDGKELKEKALQSLGFYNEEGYWPREQFCLPIIMMEEKQKCSVPYSLDSTREVSGSLPSTAFKGILPQPFSISWIL